MDTPLAPCAFLAPLRIGDAGVAGLLPALLGVLGLPGLRWLGVALPGEDFPAALPGLCFFSGLKGGAGSFSAFRFLPGVAPAVAS